MAKDSKTQFAILGVLTFGPQSGYAIAKFCREVVGFFWSESFGRIYPQLKQLHAQGLVRKRDQTGSGRKKTIYSVTAKGRRVLEEWLKEPTSHQPARNETLLKVFFGAEFPTELSTNQLSALVEAQTEMLKVLKGIEQQVETMTEFSEQQRLHFGMTIRLGILVAQARVKWARECLAILKLESNNGNTP